MKKALGLILILAGGLATAAPAQAMPKQEQDYYRTMVSTRCGIGRGNPVITRQKIDLSSTVIYEAVYGEGGWVRLDAGIRSLRGLIHINPEKKKMYCNYKQWRDRANTFVKLDPQPDAYPGKADFRMPRGATAQTIRNSRIHRTIIFFWDGLPSPIVGKVNMETGALTAALPEGKGSCTGTAMGDETAASRAWRVSCSNGLEAEGSYKGRGATKGAEGSGKDNQGRAVHYNLIPKPV